MRYQPNRACPLTGAQPNRVVGHMTAGLVVAANQTYRPEALSILELAPDDEFPIVQSPSGFAFAGWLPDDAFLRRTYEQAIDHSRSVTQEVWYRRFLLDVAARLLEAAPESTTPLKLLDYGCGYGGLLRLLACRDIIGVGYEPSAGRREVSGDQVRIVSSTDEIAEHGPYDLLICTEVLEHLSEPTHAIDALAANAKPGATLLVTVPCCTTAYMKTALDGFAAGQAQPPMFNPWEHLNYFRPEDLKALLARGGFRTIADLGRLHPARLALTSGVGGWRSDIETALRAGKRLVAAQPSTQLLCRAA